MVSCRYCQVEGGDIAAVLVITVMSEIASGGELSCTYRPGRKALQHVVKYCEHGSSFVKKKKKWIQEQKSGVMQFPMRLQTQQRELVLSPPLTLSTHVFCEDMSE